MHYIFLGGAQIFLLTDPKEEDMAHNGNYVMKTSGTTRLDVL